MRFLLTMNMPSSNGFLIHQIIFEHESETAEKLFQTLNEDIFIYGRQFYKRQRDDGESVFVDKGDIILNTAHIGKAQVYIDYEAEADSRPIQKQRPPIRGRNYY